MIENTLTVETAEEMAQALRSGATTAEELVTRSLKRIEHDNGRLNAFVLVDQVEATASARRADTELAAGLDRGPLHGIPVAVKDIFDIRGLPTRCGTISRFGIPRAETDAEVVSSIRRAGGVIVGKTTMHEFAYGATGDRSAQGPSRNPANTARMSGGSSGGSAVAVASGMVPLALGTDTAGSVRVPAALCGVVGFKPSIGRLSTQGTFPLAPSLDHVGVFARTAFDARMLYDVLLDQVGSHPASPIGGVAWMDPAALVLADPRVTRTAYEAVVRSGVRVYQTQAFDGLNFRSDLFELFSVLQSHEAYSVHANHLDADEDLIDPEVLARLREGQRITSAAYNSASTRRADFRAVADQLWEEAEVIAMPTVPVTAPLIDERSLRIAGELVEVRATLLALTSPWNLAGVPALSVPAGSVDGLPVGVQLIVRPGNEGTLFDMARSIEKSAVSVSGER
jgi:aspartyl-tRNA(Asn)/glutamyl-tRNA(Gln) amidotransferase subunit A